jgi:hypothetical protein
LSAIGFGTGLCEKTGVLRIVPPQFTGGPSNPGLLLSQDRHPCVGFLFRCYSDPDHLAVTAFDDTAEARFRRGLADELLPRELVPSAMDAEIGGWFAGERVGRPDTCRLDRILTELR